MMEQQGLPGPDDPKAENLGLVCGTWRGGSMGLSLEGRMDDACDGENENP